MSLVIIVTSIAYTNINVDIIKKKEDLQIQELVSDLRFVRSQNIMGNNAVYIIQDENSYTIRKDGDVYKTVEFVNGMHIKCALIYLEFDTDGSPKNNLGTIYINRNDSSIEEITLVPISGRVLYKEGIYQ